MSIRNGLHIKSLEGDGCALEVVTQELQLLTHIVFDQLLLQDVALRVFADLMLEVLCVGFDMLEVNQELRLLFHDHLADRILTLEMVLCFNQDIKQFLGFQVDINHVFELQHFLEVVLGLLQRGDYVVQLLDLRDNWQACACPEHA